MAHWSIRRKLSLLAIIPMIALLIGGGLFATSIALDYRSAHAARGYADALVPALKTADAMGNEFASPGTLAADPAKLKAARAATDTALAGLKPELQRLADEKSETSSAAATALKAVQDIPAFRTSIDQAQRAGSSAKTAGDISTAVHSTTDEASLRLDQIIEALTGQISSISPSQETKSDATVAQSLNQLLSASRGEQGLYARTFLGRSDVNRDTYAQDAAYIAQQTLALQNAQSVATVAQNNLLKQWTDDQLRIDNWRGDWRALLDLQVVRQKDAQGNELPIPDPQVDFNQTIDWVNSSNVNIGYVSNALRSVAAQTLDSAQATEQNALIRAGAVGGAVILTLLIVSALLATIARTVTGPLRRLRAGAVDIASVQLPAAVARIEQDGVAADVSLPPVLPADIAAGPETFEVARAVDDLGAEAVRLATAQVRLRRALDEAFVSMSRRSQSMVEKQLAIIDELESQEQDPDQLRNLFRLDHLAARMRRYNDNLLVLAGSAVRTRATAPVKVAELFRAATSEMEQYERVRLQPVSGASIAGTVAGELVHLLAELLDNAAMYSPPSSPIVLSAAFTADGGLQIEVLDAGVGISPGELDRLNARLTQPEAIDTQVPSRMGLFVVARLARRGGFGVMLQSRSDAAGTIALVRIPATLVVGAPGSTGEQPSMPASVTLRPQTPAAGARIVQQNSYASPAQPAAPAAVPAPAAAAAGAAAAAAAGIRTVDAAANGSGTGAALPKRRRGGGAGMPPQASAPVTGGDLFTPTVPAGTAGASDQLDDGESPARPGAGTDPASPPTTSIRPPIVRRSAPPETTPTGIPGMGMRSELPTLPPPGAAPLGSPAPGVPAPGLAGSGLAGSGAPGLPAPGLPVRRVSGTSALSPAPDRKPDPLDTSRPLEAEPAQATVDTPAEPAIAGSGPTTPDIAAPGVAEADPATSDRAAPRSFETAPDAGATALPQRRSGAARPVDQPVDRHIDQPDPPEQADTPAAGINGLPGLGAPISTRSAPDPLTTPSGEFRAPPNPPAAPESLGTAGGAPSAWDDALPTELAARAAAASSYTPTDPDAPMIGEYEPHEDDYPTPIFDQISVWFTADPTGSLPVVEAEADPEVIDLRDGDRQASSQTSSRWASLGDQRWLATNARASAAPDTEGTTETGLPLRRPGANLLPSAAAAAPAAPLGMPPPAQTRPVGATGGNLITPAAGAAAPGAAGGSGSFGGAGAADEAASEHPVDADLVRGRLGSYQRGLANARRARGQAPEPAFDPVGASLFTTNSDSSDEAGRTDEQGADQ